MKRRESNFSSGLPWLFSIVSSEFVSVWLHLTVAENLSAIPILGTPQLLILGTLRFLHLKSSALLGAALALALHPALVLLLTEWLFPTGQWWWAYFLTLPGAVVGALLLGAYDRRLQKSDRSPQTLSACFLVLAPILLNYMIGAIWK